MKNIFFLSKENLSLAKEEVLSLIGNKDFGLIDNLLIIENKKNKNLSKRLAYTHKIYQFLFKCREKDFEKNMETFNWQKIYRKNFCLRLRGTEKYKERDAAGFIWNKIKNPKVNLEKPETLIEVFFVKQQAVAGLFLYETDKSYIKRQAHLRPGLHPSATDQRLARVMINLTGAEKNSRILDPFCGTGGILIEALFMGLKAEGCDNNKFMIKKAEENLKFYNLKCMLSLKDALTLNKKFNFIVTDLPYGKDTKSIKNLNKFYKDFLLNSYGFARKMVVTFPDFVKYRKLLGKWKLVNEFDYYLHKSLSKKIVVLKQ